MLYKGFVPPEGVKMGTFTFGTAVLMSFQRGHISIVYPEHCKAP